LIIAIVTCPNPPDVAFATISSQTGSNYNDSITYTCNIGYESTDGTLDRKCNENKLWDGTPPVCTIVTCPNPPDVAFATISSQTGSNYNDSITYTCNIGYENKDGTLVRKCMENKLWDGTIPVCSKKNTITTILKRNSGPIVAGGLMSFGFLMIPIAFCCLLKGRSKEKYMDTSSHELS
ncbi:cub 3-like and sushi domain-containing protein, partial [Mytilus galloprovincialis]